jgi:hypothetical protein
MQGISKYSRLRITAVAALVAAGLVLMAMSASASANVFVKRISLGIRNSSRALIEVKVCTNRNVSGPLRNDRGALISAYEDGDAAQPCGTIDHLYSVPPGQRVIVPNANPVGVIISNVIPHSSGPAQDKTLYFLARNKLFEDGAGLIAGELPYFQWGAWGSYKNPFDQGQAVLRDVDGVSVELRRYHDEDRHGESVKVMRIEIRHWPGIG